jgi:hypothetical protein
MGFLQWQVFVTKGTDLLEILLKYSLGFKGLLQFSKRYWPQHQGSTGQAGNLLRVGGEDGGGAWTKADGARWIKVFRKNSA